jgi:hypothetical protein
MSAKARRTFRTIGSATVNWNQASTAAGTGVTTTAAIPGAQQGDAVIVTPLVPTAGILYSATVSGPSTVIVRGQNVTASTIDPAATTFAIIVLRP